MIDLVFFPAALRSDTPRCRTLPSSASGNSRVYPDCQPKKIFRGDARCSRLSCLRWNIDGAPFSEVRYIGTTELHTHVHGASVYILVHIQSSSPLLLPGLFARSPQFTGSSFLFPGAPFALRFRRLDRFRIASTYILAFVGYIQVFSRTHLHETWPGYFRSQDLDCAIKAPGRDGRASRPKRILYFILAVFCWNAKFRNIFFDF